jgi:hypothetical protein
MVVAGVPDVTGRALPLVDACICVHELASSVMTIRATLRDGMNRTVAPSPDGVNEVKFNLT